MSSAQILILLLVIAAVVIAALIFLAARKRRSQKLRQRFGPEYDRVVQQEGDVHKGERVLEFRQKHREKLKIRPLSPSDRDSFSDRWREVQGRFVDDPKGAVTLADSLITDVMQVRGYPIADFEQRASDLSVDHPIVVENYRAAHAIALRHSRGEASTEDLRKAMVHYRALFEELVNETGARHVETTEVQRRREA
jgi:hypothetical protein